MDFSKIDDTTVTTQDTTRIDESWRGYPQNMFGNWTPDQVGRSQMLLKCSKNQSSTIYWMDVLNNGMFARANMGNGDTSTVRTANEDEFWDMLQGEVSHSVF
jgi:hypothetical protein